MDINKLIIHEVQRHIDAGPLTVVRRPSVNDLAGLSPNLADSLIHLFVNASLTIGGFGVNGDHGVQPAFEQRLVTYTTLNTDTAFVEFTDHIAQNFEAILNEPTKQTVKGGYLVFYEYSFHNQEWLAVVILNKTQGIDVNQSLDVIATQLLDLAKLHIGATINLTKWRAADGERYIKFRTGLASEVRDYFERLIGCQRDQLAIKVETQQLKKTIEDFARSQNLNIDQINDILNDAYKFISPRVNESQPVLLTELINSIFPDKVDGFFDYIGNKDIDLSQDITIDKNTLKTFRRFTAHWNDINLTFGRRAVGKNITVDDDKIILVDAPPWLIEDIQKILNPDHDQN